MLGMVDDDIGVLARCSKLNCLHQIRETLSEYYDQLVEYYEEELIPLEGLYSSGEETYGYESLEKIKSTLYYISDRWKSSFRVRWLIDLINPDYILYGDINGNN